MQSMRFRTVLLIALVIAAMAAVYYPIHVIRPFRAQGARELQAALIVARWSPWLTLLFALLGAVVTFPMWRSRGLLRKVGVSIAMLLLVFSAVAARVNVYEIMFNPVSSARFVPAAEATYEPNDMVMAVQVNGEKRAYPVRTMGYHHVLNDVVAGEPLVATY
jgi:hypothetical protein